MASVRPFRRWSATLKGSISRLPAHPGRSGPNSWDPLQGRLHPVRGDSLEEWTAGYLPTFDGFRIVGHRWSSEFHAMRNVLARNQAPFQRLDIAAARLLGAVEA